VLVNLLDFGMDVQAAGDAPRIEHVGSATPTGRRERGVGAVEAEPGISHQVIEELEWRGQIIVPVRKNGGGYQGILIEWDKGTLRGGSESRRDGEAKGY
jgi:gamma-glutamyltranspeptidase/glutathione hydrolase